MDAPSPGVDTSPRRAENSEPFRMEIREPFLLILPTMRGSDLVAGTILFNAGVPLLGALDIAAYACG